MTETATTLLLERTDAGDWRATQAGVDLVGRGPSAARAAQRYCELVADSGAEQVATDGGEP